MTGENPAASLVRLAARAASPRALLIEAAAALALGGLVALGGLSLWHALIALILVALAAAAAGPDMEKGAGRPPEPPASVAASLQDVLDAAPAAAVAIDAEGLVTAAGRRAREAFSAIVPGQPLIYAFRDPDFVFAIEAVLAGQEPGEITLSGASGPRTAHRVFIAPLAGGGALVTLIDQTEIIRTEAMRVEFVANASHELRTPLASLLGFIETLQGPARDDAAAREKFLGIMNGQAKRMARLINNLLSLSRIEQRAHIRPEGKADLAALAGQINDSLRPLASASGVTLSLQLAGAGPFLVRGDDDELLRLIENLVENAVKYGQPGERADITLERTDAGISISVRDFGPGIAPEHLPRLTERFYRVDSPAGGAKSGTGLGLALVKHITARHGGRLSIESAPGEGAKFTVTLPEAV